MAQLDESRVAGDSTADHIADHNQLHAKVNNTFDVVADFGAVGDGSTDDSTSFQDAFNAAAAVGGVVTIPDGTFRIDSRLIVGFNDDEPWPQRPVIIRGAGADAYSGVTTTRAPSGGTILDMRSTDAPGCLDLRGSGRVTITGITFYQAGTAHTNPYIYATNTVVQIDGCSFFGHLDKSQGTCNQDAIVLGGTSGDDGAEADSQFQGYGSVIDGNHFNRIRRCVWLRGSANGIVVRDNNVWHLCGGGDGIGAIQVTGNENKTTSGGVVIGNLIEMSGYYYGIVLDDATVGFNVAFNNFYDPGDNLTSCIYLSDTARQHIVIGGYHATTHPLVVDDGTLNTIIQSHDDPDYPSVFGLPARFEYDGRHTYIHDLQVGSELKFQSEVALVEASNYINMVRSAAEDDNAGAMVFRVNQKGELYLGGTHAGSIYFRDQAGDALASINTNGKRWELAGTGGEMRINSGTGGSYLVLQNYGLQLKDQAGNNPVYIRQASGSPEESYAAPVGSLYLRTDGGEDTTLYVKESGTGNTGWVAK